jgi:hypothetical protein
MNKQEVIASAKNLNCEMVEVSCIVCVKSKASKETVLVRMVENPKDEDKIDNSKYLEIFDYPTDFEDNCYFREGCTNFYPIPFISNFTDVKPWEE